MADNTYNYGFRWHSNINGGPQPKPIWLPLASAYDAAPGGVHVNMRPGDLVKEVSDGTVQLAVAGDAIYGVITAVGPYYDSAQGCMVFADSIPFANGAYGSNLSRQTRVAVLPANGIIFQAMCDDSSTITTEANWVSLVHNNVDMINVAVTGYAHPQIDISTLGTPTAQFRVVGLLRRADVDFTGKYVPILVTINEGRLPPFSATGV